MHRVLCVIALIAYSVTAFGQSKQAKNESILFSIAKSSTTTDEFIYTYRKNHQNKKENFTEPKIGEYLDLYINFKLKITEAKARGLDTTAKFKKEFSTYREDLKRPYRAEKDIVSKLAKETYARLSEEVKASHILIALKESPSPADTLEAYKKIIDARGRALKGEDFGKLAQELSEDPSAKYNQGDLGYFTALQMVYPFEEAAYALKVGEISNPIRTRFGYHIIKLSDRKPARGEVEVSHILLRKGADDNAKLKSKIFEIFDQIKAGRDWNELCKEFSEDINTKNSGGRLRPFGVGSLPTLPEFEAEAFALKNTGDVTDPFESSLGWHIVRLEKHIPLPSFAEMESSLQKRMAHDERVQISEKKMVEKRKRDLGFLQNKEIRNRVLKLADTTLTEGKWFVKADKELNGQVLFTINKKTFTVGDFLLYAQRNQEKTNLAPEAFTEKLMNAYEDGKLSDEEDEMLSAANPEFKNLLAEYREGILLFEVMEKEVWNKASEDTTGQRKFYLANLSRYKAGDRVEARIMSTTDKSLVEDVKRKIDKGDTLKNDDLKRFKSIQPFRAYEKGDSKVIDRINWVPGVYDAALDGIYYLVEVKRLIAPGTKSMEDARASVISDYQDYLEKNWIAQLKEKYPIRVNKKGKNIVLKELVSP